MQSLYQKMQSKTRNFIQKPSQKKEIPVVKEMMVVSENQSAKSRKNQKKSVVPSPEGPSQSPPANLSLYERRMGAGKKIKPLKIKDKINSFKAIPEKPSNKGTITESPRSNEPLSAWLQTERLIAQLESEVQEDDVSDLPSVSSSISSCYSSSSRSSSEVSQTSYQSQSSSSSSSDSDESFEFKFDSNRFRKSKYPPPTSSESSSSESRCSSIISRSDTSSSSQSESDSSPDSPPLTDDLSNSSFSPSSSLYSPLSSNSTVEDDECYFGSSESISSQSSVKSSTSPKTASTCTTSSPSSCQSSTESSSDDFEAYCYGEKVNQDRGYGRKGSYSKARKPIESLIQSDSDEIKQVVPIKPTNRVETLSAINQKQKICSNPLTATKMDYSNIRSKVDASCPKSFNPRPTSMSSRVVRKKSY